LVLTEREIALGGVAGGGVARGSKAGGGELKGDQESKQRGRVQDIGAGSHGIKEKVVGGLQLLALPWLLDHHMA
jgi:hypothetical protein